MEINSEKKDYIFSLIKEYFDFPLTAKDFKRCFEEFELGEKGFRVESGAAKKCLFHEEFDNCVVKFCLEDFDYCEREYTNYLAAIEKGFNDFFPYTDYLGYFNGIKFFVQEQAYCDNEAISSIWYHAILEDYIPEEEDENEYILNEKILDLLYDLEDEQRVSYCFGYNEKLLDFLDEYCINDLHDGNFGYIDGEIVIIDFSGYGFLARERRF